MDSVLTIGIPCRADEPDLAGTLESLLAACRHPELPRELTVELAICINGLPPGTACPALTAVRHVCTRHGVPVREMRVPPATGASPGVAGHPATPQGSHSTVVQAGCSVLLTEELGKPRAWNVIWQQTSGGRILFCDADVRVDRDAVARLYARLHGDPCLRLVAAREVPLLGADATRWSRMGAIPYRFDFGNAGGRLYLIRKEAVPGGMPEDLLLEDAWLTAAVGRRRVAKEPRARVFFLPPATWRDYVAERVRTEGGKIQIRRVHGALLREGPIARYSFAQFWQGIVLREWPLVLLALGFRGLAHAWAWLALTRRSFYSLYRPFPSTKGWTPHKEGERSTMESEPRCTQPS